MSPFAYILQPQTARILCGAVDLDSFRRPYVDIELAGFAKECFVLKGAAPMAVAGGLRLGIHLRFHDQAPEQLAVGLAFQKAAADQLQRHHLGGPGKKRLGRRRK
jgi:hypothetical protein